MDYNLIILVGIFLLVSTMERSFAQPHIFAQMTPLKIKDTELQRHIQRQIRKNGICNPEEQLHLPPFN